MTQLADRPLRRPPLFAIGQMIATPKEVCEARIAKVVGCEWGPDNYQLRGNGWVYLIQFYVCDPRPEVNHIWPSNGVFQATEEEVLKWQESQ